MNSSKQVKRLVYLAMLTALAIAVHILESSIPIPLPLGVKLGLANIMSLVVIEVLGVKEMFIVNFLRVVISGLLTGIFMSYPWFMSCGGVLLSSISLAIINKFFDLPMITKSIICAICHNVGQIIVLSIVMSSQAFLPYLFVMLASSIPTGLFTGLVAIEVLKRVDPKKLGLQ